MLRKPLLLYSFFILFPLVTFAHVKWFAIPAKAVRPYSITDIWVIVWVVISLTAIYIGYILEKKINLSDGLRNVLDSLGSSAQTVFTIGIGLSLILFSLNGYVFAPNFLVEGTFGTTFIVIQAVIGAMVLLGVYTRICALLLFLLFALVTYNVGFLGAVEALEMVGVSVYLFLVGRPKWSLRDIRFSESFTERIIPYSAPLLRFFTGINLIVLGFTEKILNPSLTQSFLTEYHWNYMQNSGFLWFTDYWFAFSVGVIESLIGVFLVLGILTRVTTLLLASIFITTLVLLGPVELVGHLPHFSIALVLLVFGSGNKLKI